MATSVPVTALGERLNPRAIRLLAATLLMALFVSSLNQQIIATAAPHIVADLGGFKLLSWVFTVFMLVSTIVTPLTGKLSDSFGRKPLMVGGMVVLILGSALCGISVSMPMLIAARAVQGVGSGMVSAIVTITFWDLFPPARASRLLPYFVAGGTTAQLSGPTVGGLLTDHAGWRWNFFIGMPFAIAAIVLVALFLPSQRRTGPRPRVDVGGACLLAVSSGTLLLALAWAQGQFGWGSAQTLGLFATAITVGIVFLQHERGHPEAIVPLHLLRHRDFMLGTAILACSAAVTLGGATYLPTFLQTALGTTATASGLVTTPQALGALGGSFLGGQLLARTGRFRLQLLAGLALALCGALVVRTVGIGDDAWRVSLSVAAIGFGGGIASTTMTVVTLNVIPHGLIGVATGTRQFLQQNGAVLAIALYGVILTTSYRSGFDARLAPELRARLPAAVADAFADPTLALDAHRYGDAQDAVRRLDGGETLLDSAITAQRQSVAHANANIFLLAAVLAAAGIVAALAIHEAPIRRTFDSKETDLARGPGSPTAGAPPAGPATADTPSV